MYKFDLDTGFTLAEVCVSMIIMSLIVVLTLPLMTGRKLFIGTDRNTQICILKDSGDIATNNCISTISNCKINNSNNSCNNLISYANNGTSAQKTSALKVLQETCNQGGVLACNFFINLCVNDNTKCNITTPASGIRPFLLKNNFDNTFGKLFLEENLKDYYNDNIMNIFNEVNTDCPSCNSANAACNIKGIGNCSCTLSSAAGDTMVDGTKKVANWNPVTGTTCSSGVNCRALCTTTNDLTGPLIGGTFYWNNGTTNYSYTYANSLYDGLLNTNTIAGLSDTESPHQAAQACYDLVANGHNDWYLPADSELVVLYSKKAVIGNFTTSCTSELVGGFTIWTCTNYNIPSTSNTSAPSSYWSSTERSGYNNVAEGMDPVAAGGNPSMGGYGKTYAFSVRCIRRD